MTDKIAEIAAGRPLPTTYAEIHRRALAQAKPLLRNHLERSN